MPGPISQSSSGPSDDSPYLPSWLYKNGPKMCPCGHAENYHGDNGGCSQWRKCGCTGIPENCLTSSSEMD